LKKPQTPPLLYRVCFADTDALGIVYHARYLEFAERSRNQALCDAGVDTTELFRGGFGVALVLHRIGVTYRGPAFPNDVLELRTALSGHGPARLQWRTWIERDAATLCLVDAEIACIDLDRKQPTLIPDRLRQAIAGGEPPCSTSRKASDRVDDVLVPAGG
jgi:acyl-CoA thioester hydrolase